MLSDISNRAFDAPSSPSAAKTAGANKRPLLASLSSEGDVLLPSKLRVNRSLASASSSSSPAPSSPFFPSTRLDAFIASSSPPRSASLKPPTSPVHRLSSLHSLPPSSPSFAFSSSTATEALSSEAAPVFARKPAANHDAALEAPRVLHLERGTVLYFGRKAKRSIPRPSSSAPGETYIPVLLPSSAKNASRLHCSARLLPAEDEGKVMVEIRVTGMNGMKVDGKLFRQGSVGHWTVEPGRRMSLKFWGGYDYDLVVAEADIDLADVDNGDLSDAESVSYGRSRSASPASSSAGTTSSSRRKLLPDSFFRPSSPPPELTVDSPSRPSAPLPPSAGAVRAEKLVDTLDLDLPGLIASAIVFHPRATVAVDEVIRALLRETGALWRVLSDEESEVERRKETQEGEDEAVEAWRDMVEECLDGQEMFGRIDNTGLKDAAGHPIPPAYYYVPDADSSPERVAALEPFVKRVRGARAKGGVRYFWAKPSLRKNR
ncbi:hypothetical protein JCM10213_003510 [Rhodosporidiobolus nylandii]